MRKSEIVRSQELLCKIKGLVTAYNIAANSPLFECYQEREPLFDLFEVIDGLINALEEELKYLKQNAD